VAGDSHFESCRVSSKNKMNFAALLPSTISAMTLVNASDAKRDMDKWLDRVENEGQVISIQVKGETKGVLVPVTLFAEYLRLKAAAEHSVRS
jgi:PHD/YefM family antitoxin component YafN of YafNO toxin-antitoxin module